MRKLQILKTFVDVFWFMSLLSGIALLIFIPFALFSEDKFDIPIKISGHAIVIDTVLSKIILILNVISFYVFAFGVFKLRKLLELFRKRLIFEELNTLLLNQIGICFLTTSVISSTAEVAYNTFVQRNLTITSTTDFGSFLFTASIGLLFMVLSEVFKIARNIRLENDMTI